MIPCVKKEFFEELRLEFDRRAKMLDSLTKKTTNLMITAGVVSAILFGFQTLPLEFEQDKMNSIWPHLILISISLLLGSIILCVGLNSAERQNTLFLGKNFLNKSNKVDLEIMKEWTTVTADEYYEELSEIYIECLIQSESVIKSRSTLLTYSILFFLGGLVSVPIFLATSIFF